MIKRDQNGWHINLDILFIYLVALMVVVVLFIKALRWAVSP